MFLVRAARWTISVGAGLLVAGALLYLLQGALTPLIAAFVLAYLFDPMIGALERRGIPRRLAVGGAIGVLALVGAAGPLLLIPELQADWTALRQSLPGYLDRLEGEVIPGIERRLDVELPGTLRDWIGQLRESGVAPSIGTLRELVVGVAGTVRGTVQLLVALLVIPVLAYYVLVDFERILRGVARCIPLAQREYALEKARQVDRLVSGFLRGQLLVCAILGALYAIGFGLIGVDFAIGVAVLAAVLSLIPYLGNAVALVAASALCLLEFGLDGHLAAVVGWYAFVQALEGWVITPRIVGGRVGLRPPVVIVALMIAGDLLGFAGLLIAVPVAAVMKVLLGEAIEAYRASAWFREAAPPPAPPASRATEGDDR